MTGRAKRDAARDASESITQVIQDEKTKLIKATSTPQPPPPTTNASEQHQEAQKPKVINKSPKKSAKSRKRARSKETIRSKADELQHGWMPLGETFKRPILKPVRKMRIRLKCNYQLYLFLGGELIH